MKSSYLSQYSDSESWRTEGSEYDSRQKQEIILLSVTRSPVMMFIQPLTIAFRIPSLE
jgi:hypothetical protein